MEEDHDDFVLDDGFGSDDKFLDPDFVLVEPPISTAEEDVEELANNRNKTRKRVRNQANWKRNLAKRLRNSGQGYVNQKRGEITPKAVQVLLDHHCRYECTTFTEEERQQIFSKYWELGTWDLQTAFLTSCMEVSQPKRRYVTATSNKSVSVCLKLKGKRICKLFLLKTLDISLKRYDNVLKKRHETGISPTDKRGKHEPANKICDEKKKIVKEHIRSFPRYTSHYSRMQNPNTKYLSPQLNITKLYELYTKFCNERGVEPVKVTYYRHMFNTMFNLRFKKPHTDTCNKCDVLQNKIDHGDSNNEANNKRTKELHLRNAEKAMQSRDEAKKLASNDSSVRAICFDLEKTLPTPFLTCGTVFYMRQLWTYNLGIHDLASGQASMFMWHEGEANRGSQEIGSCLLKYVQQLPLHVKHLVAFSDNYGGQNKNQNIVKYWMYIVAKTDIETIDHKFFISGHSYMECDRDFGAIEKLKKKMEFVFVPSDWAKFVSKASKRFTVNQMGKEDFFSIQNVAQRLRPQVKGITKMQWLRFKKETPTVLYFKNTLNEDIEFETLDLKLNQRGKPPCLANVVLDVLYQEPVAINTAKYNNLMNLLQYIPPIHHDFYKTLQHKNPNKLKKNNITEPEEEADDALTELESEYHF